MGELCDEVSLIIGNNLGKGRPKKLFSQSSDRTKQREIKQIVSEIDSDKLSYVTESSLIKSGERTVAKIVKFAVTTSPRSLKKMKELHQSPSTSAESIAANTPDEALSLIVDLSLGKDVLEPARRSKSKRS
ncbi:hypothetical protein JTE90_012634 [Oedothorax gibbosus]|uniref:Uncharacterized protein n=1 Tax=Oedothorax gibbosus TaxID=931172 RepID=A0AAV6UJF4_9ARAC|nr:hypothetical protein JTE90_012634 [Oedothorax gibbosus]